MLKPMFNIGDYVLPVWTPNHHIIATWTPARIVERAWIGGGKHPSWRYRIEQPGRPGCWMDSDCLNPVQQPPEVQA